MPNGRSIALERQPGADIAGNAGLQDEVDHHWGKQANYVEKVIAAAKAPEPTAPHL